MPVEHMTEAKRNARLGNLKQLLNDVGFIWFSVKMVFILLHEQATLFTE